MADATCSQVVWRDMEERMGELHMLTEQRHQEVKGELAQVQESMTQMQDLVSFISRQLVEVLQHRANPHEEIIKLPLVSQS